MTLLPIPPLSYNAPLEIHQISVDTRKIISYSRKIGESASFKRDYAEIFGYALQLRRIIHSNLISDSQMDADELEEIARLMDAAALHIFKNSSKPSSTQKEIKVLTKRILKQIIA